MSLNMESEKKPRVRFESTPNPATLKFLLPMKVTEEGFQISDVRDADRSPLALKIFGFPWTSSVYIGPDFITVTKQDWVEWGILAEPLANLMDLHLQRGEPVVVERTASPTSEGLNDDPISRQIRQIIDTEIRPAVALDGGDIVFSHYKQNKVYVHMKGSCAGCPSSTATLKDGIEARLREALPEIEEVISIEPGERIS